MKKIKIKIKSTYGKVLFAWESKTNTQRETVIEAIKSSANLSYADLRSANLSYADLRSANLSYADLSHTDLRSANLSHTDLRSANLSYADLRSANLSSANLSYADLRSANLSHTDLNSADLREIKHNEGTGFLLCQCPTEGSFIGWKTAQGRIVKLQICEDAKRSSATTLKCRCSKALVLDIQNIDGTHADITQICSNQDSSFIYEIGKIVSVPDFDEDRFNECSRGIHFFISRDSAVQYS